MDPTATATPQRLRAARWLAWLWAGVGPEATATEQRKIMQANAAAAITIATVLSFNLLYMSTGNAALMRSGWAQLPVALVAPLTWWLNRRGRLFEARWFIFANAMAGTGLVIVGGQGTAAGAQVYYVMYALLPAMFYPVAQWRSSLALGVMNLGVFFYLHTSGWPAHADLAQLEPARLASLRTQFIVGCVLAVAAVVALSEHTADRNERLLLQLARTDPLTGLPNRRAFRQQLTAEVSRALRQGQPLSVAIIDVDHFKRVNDSMGHDGGDAALRHVASVLGGGVRSYDVLARIGGEEFSLLMPGANLDQAVQGMNRLRSALAAQTFEHGGHSMTITFSAGVLQVVAGMNEDQILHRADEALYRAKHAGRDRVEAVA